jgi:hypothetical protein
MMRDGEDQVGEIGEHGGFRGNESWVACDISGNPPHRATVANAAYRC